MRVYNFSPGPSALPLEVLERAAKEMTDTNGTGQSVMEMSHRSKDYKPIFERTEALLRELMGIPSNYKVLFLQGGASLQFSMIPLNLAAGEQGSAKKKAVYIDTGVWAKKASDEAAKYAEVSIPASSKDKAYAYIPAAPKADSDAAYYHITLNNTIVGTKWASIPDTGAVPLISDISSCILSEPLDVSKFGLLYAGAQKNLGPAGTTVVIIREDLIGHAPAWTPALLRYDIHAAEASMYNTPPCYGIYIIGLVLEWLKNLGGVSVIAQKNREKANLFYSYLESSKHFLSPVEKVSRSLMNIPFVPRETDPEKRKDIETRFVKEAGAAGLVNLAGHRLVGGMRASIYNAMPIEGVKALIAFAEKFEGSL
ncbi:3-phosphoserine/phosphohydroxythreonine transaminase [Leadbettera azotonutricia]|uniref:Phosphoserine aminotransferase n=1 Tax=Leadbettera azotonutricia (strain ATCC BAA-888 / DSM 13862 / ZAS-9) TaxID=545695 RepID=F5YCD2_LEAAZ|nr:3-phosphoserine/phosphohydroxythreonine transaminase [Leadbettera azotonutricia]AEF82609.1 phosphoserine transaminase [Leadbettera azotonutricia ZAS-9]